MSNNVTSVLLRLFFLSLILGLVLSVFNISPEGLLGVLGSTVASIFNIIAEAIAWTVPFVLIGAIVVVPVWFVLRAIRLARLRGRR